METSPPPPPPPRGVATGTNQERGAHVDARDGHLAEGGVRSLTGSTFEESTSFEYGHDAKSPPPLLREELVPPKSLTFV